MATHLTAVKMQAPTPPHVYWGWCETCHRTIGPEVEHSITARDILAAHEANPTLSDSELLALIPRRDLTS
jgi:hypothetical protein